MFSLAVAPILYLSGMERLWIHMLMLILEFTDFVQTHDLNQEFHKGSYFKRNRIKRDALDDFHYHEEVVPRIYHGDERLPGTLHEGEHLEDITIKFQAFNKSFVLDLKLNKNLLSKNYVENFYHSKGNRISRPSNPRKSHCYYHGHVRNLPHSMVALSTCNGINGFIEDTKEFYHIQPSWDSDRQHLLYRHSDKKHEKLKCGTGDSHMPKMAKNTQELFKRSKRSIGGPYDRSSKSRFIELYLVHDHQAYLYHGQDYEMMIQRSKDIVNIVSKLYHSLNIYVALVGVEVWASVDNININSNSEETINNFLRYRKERISPKYRNDNAQLITAQQFSDKVVGKAKKGSICSFQNSGGINMDYNSLVTFVATTVAHEMGHNLGMEHDNSTCYCTEDRCIMEPISGETSPTKWSSCSHTSWEDALEMGMDYCLRNKPDSLYDGPVCGNNFVEPGEECDCGLPEMCSSHCCDSLTCKLHSNATCATGACCDLNTCKLQHAGLLCRSSAGECDLAEYCRGDSEYCPDDVYRYMGSECKGGEAYCYEGQCRTHTDQCQLLWGNTGYVSTKSCFTIFNVHGNRSGNCGYNWTTDAYYRCRKSDAMCGMLHCVHKNEKLAFWKDNLAHYFSLAYLKKGSTRYVCRGAILDVGLDMPDPGMVPNGAKCGDGKMCYHQQCLDVSSLRIPRCEAGCTGHGVCNSQGNCHCDDGYGWPLCDKAGPGGSANSGPATSDDGKGLMIALLIFFLLILPLLGVATFVAYYHRDKLKKWWTLHVDIKYRLPTKKSKPPSATPSKPPETGGSFNQNRLKNPPKRPVPFSVDITSPVLTGCTNRMSQGFVNATPIPSSSGIPGQSHRPQSPGLVDIQKEKEPSVHAAKTKVQNAKDPSGRAVKTKVLRDISREISNPILISSTNRNSQAFVNHNHIANMAKMASSQAPPPVPLHANDQIVTVNRTPSAAKPIPNRPPPPRPTSVPAVSPVPLSSRRSVVSTSTRRPDRPPPLKPTFDDDNQIYINEDELQPPSLNLTDLTSDIEAAFDSKRRAMNQPDTSAEKAKSIEEPPVTPKVKFSGIPAKASKPKQLPSTQTARSPTGVSALKAKFNQPESSTTGVSVKRTDSKTMPKPPILTKPNVRK